MIIPFVYDITDLFLDNPDHLWIFYKYLYFAKQNNFPIIASDIYFKDYEEYFSNPDNVVKTSGDIFDYKIVDSKFRKKMQRYAIQTDDIRKSITLVNKFQKICDNLTIVDDNLYKKLNNIIDTILADYGNAQITFLSWTGNATLKKIAEERNYKIIYQELSSIRNNNYNATLCYFSFNDKYNDSQEKNYEEFKKITNKVKILSRKEILALFLNENKLEFLRDIKPEYKIGFSPGIQEDQYFALYSSEEQEDTLKKLRKYYKDENISIRFHPNHLFPLNSNDCIIDKSQFSFEWIVKNDAIVTSVSNIGFEAMLYGKTVYNLSSHMPFSFLCNDNVDIIDNFVVPASFISYMCFGYFVPLELAFDKDYINWRLTNPKIEEIYNKNLRFILAKKKISINNINIFNILTKYCGMDENASKEIINYNASNLEKEKITKLDTTIAQLEIKSNDLIEKCNQLEQEISDYSLKIKQSNIEIEKNKEEIKNLNIYIYNLENSKSWKITKPLRQIIAHLKKEKKND